MRLVTIQEVERVAFRLAQEQLTQAEPIPAFGTRFENKLESCLAVPFQRFGGKNLYHGLISRAAILFYLLVKNHPFQNGNKRVALVTLLFFLYKNGKWLRADDQELVNFAIWVAQSPASLRESTVSGVEEFIKKHLVPLR